MQAGDVEVAMVTLSTTQLSVLGVGIFDYTSFLEPCSDNSGDDLAAVGVDKDEDDAYWDDQAQLLGDAEGKLAAGNGTASLTFGDLSILSDAVERISPDHGGDVDEWADEVGLSEVEFTTVVAELTYLLRTAMAAMKGPDVAPA